MQINTNMAALNAWRSLESNQSHLQSSLQRLSSGQRINGAADDAAGLAVSEKMTAQTRGLTMATRNTQDAVSLVQTADGGANSIQDMLQRMRELSVQAGSDTLSDDDRSQLQEEFSSLQSEIDRTAGSVQFNGQKLLNGDAATSAAKRSGDVATATVDATKVDTSLAGRTLTVTTNGSGTLQIMDGSTDVTSKFTDTTGSVVGKSSDTYDGVSFTYTTGNNKSGTASIGGLTFQVGANNGDTIGTAFDDLRTTALKVDSGTVTISDKASATNAISKLDDALKTVSSSRARMGAMQNRLTNTISTLQTQNENLTAANSRIKDVDMAAEMANFTKYQVLSQASTAMLAQANQLPQGILSLLR